MAADRRQWDVFLSFRGEDTRHGFTKTLYEALTDLGVRAFLDDDGLRRGDEIAPSLLEAIEDSAAAVVILSAKYADSRWCLEELSRICQLSATRRVLPVFYFVDPSHVRKQTGPFENDFRAHEARFGKVVVDRWRKGMETVGNFAGFPVFDHSQEKHIIKSLVKTVMDEMAKTPVNLEYTVGLEPSIEKLTRLLELKSNGVKVLGLYGMGGIGKTTLAKALFNHLVGRAGFESRSFVPNVREITARENGLESLRKKLAQDLSADKKSLVVLDDVDDAEQVKALVLVKGELFFDGSRIIVTTRDREALPEKIVSVKYEVRELDSEGALKLFSHHAQRREEPTENLRSISREIVSLTGGLPLALEVFGSMLLDKRRVEEWRDSLQKLREIRPANLQDVLKMSYNGLDEQEKCVFLDIACLFAGMSTKRDYLVDVLGGCGFNGEIAISDLTSKSLVKINDEHVVSMHDQIRDMGRQIVKEESVADPRSQSRLWNRDDIMALLLDDQRRTCVEGISLDYEAREKMVRDVDGGRIAWDRLHRSPNLSNALSFLKERYKQYKEDEAERMKEIKILGKAVERIPNLRLLRVNNVSLEGDFEFPHQLKWLQWKGCPLKGLRSDIYAKGLVVVDLSQSKIERFWSRRDNKMMAENLKVLNLSDCYHLVALPKLSENQKLEKLILKNCVNLTQIDDSIGNSNTLIHLDLQNCKNLTKFPSDVSGWKSLQTLILSRCFKLKQLPENIGDARSLKQLFVDETAIETFPESIFRLTRLETLDLKRCSLLRRLPVCIGKMCSLKKLSLNSSGLEELPDSIRGLENLETLNLMWCSSLTVLPDSVGDLKQLKELFFLSSPIGEIPNGVGSLPNLKSLWIGKGNFIGALPSSINGLHSLVDLQIHETSITNLPDEIGGLRSLKKLELWKCKYLVSLPDSIGNALSLTTLIVFEGIIKELPESIGKLENLVTLRLNLCRELRKLPDSIGGLKSLHRLMLQETAVTELPESFGKLSSLVQLQVSKNPRTVGDTESVHEGVFFPISFSNLSSLSVLNARARKISGEILDDFEKLTSLENLNLGYNCFTRLPSSLRGLSVLKKLQLPNCIELKALPPLPSSLIEINLANCFVLETISDLSNLVSLEELDLTNCEKVEDIPGLECLESMKRLYMSCCDKCSLVTKKRLAKASLRNIRNLSMPGSKIPSWFTRDVIKFTKHRNRPIKGVAVCAVVSLDRSTQDENIDSIPGIVDIQVQILKQDLPVFTTTFNLKGVPRRSEDQIHLCRFSGENPLVSQLKDGFKIAVTRRNPPFMKGVELKKWGVHLIYEGDDDYEGDEESLKESQQSTSEKLGKFFSTHEEEEKEEEDPEISGRAE